MHVSVSLCVTKQRALRLAVAGRQGETAAHVGFRHGAAGKVAARRESGSCDGEKHKLYRAYQEVARSALRSFEMVQWSHLIVCSHAFRSVISIHGRFLTQQATAIVVWKEDIGIPYTKADRVSW